MSNYRNGNGHAEGMLTFFTGPMKCQKTLELVRNLMIYRETHIPIVCVRPARDTRSAQVASKSGLVFEAVTVNEQDAGAFERATRDALVIGIDEIQFFTPDIVPVITRLLLGRKIIFAAGLDADFRGIPFPTSHALIALPETDVVRMRSVCEVCKSRNATRSQRLVGGKPASPRDDVVVVEHAAGAITYEARCLACHIVPPS